LTSCEKLECLLKRLVCKELKSPVINTPASGYSRRNLSQDVKMEDDSFFIIGAP